MGEMADYYRERDEENMWMHFAEEQELKRQVEELEHLYKMGALKWSTKDKGDLLVQKMTANHVFNTKQMLRRAETKDIVTMKWIEIFEIELEKRR